MSDRHLVVLLGLLGSIGCTPRPTASLEHPAKATPKVRSPTESARLDESGKARWVDLSIESEFGCAVERTGSVHCWGRGPSAEMMLRELPPQPTTDPMSYFGVRKWGPASRVELIHDARRISTSTGLACAIVEDGRVRCWGSFRWGTHHVFDVPGIAKAVDLEIGDGESCATLESGELWCWGADDYGVPRVRLGATLAVSVSDSIACGLTHQGDVACWGQGIEDWHRYDQQFNRGLAPSPSPAAAAAQEFPDSLEIGRFRGATDLVLTAWNTLCILRGDGKVLCSDRDVFALLRKEDLGMREVIGAQAVADLVATRSHVCARTVDERALCWGRNVYGQLGDGGSSNREQAAPVASLEGVVALSVAEDFSCAVTRDDQIACWGFDRGEALGREDLHVHTLENLRASSIAAAGHLSCAVDEAKTLRCWGGGESIEVLGIAGAARPSPINLPSSGDIVGLASGWETCFLLSSGSLQCGSWSGYGSGASSFVPSRATADVHDLANGQPPACTITGTGRKAQLNCGQSFGMLEPETRLKEPFDISSSSMRACVAHGSGKVSCFAEFYYWGDGPRPEREFKPVPGLGDVIAVSSATYHDCALRKNGHVTCWAGRVESQWSEDGRTATAVHYRMSDPADMGLEQIVQLVSGSQHHCALSKTGKVSCWADSLYAEQTTWLPVPELGADVVEIAAGSDHTCARTRAGKVSCWGDDVWGQLGRVPSRVYLTPTVMKIE